MIMVPGSISVRPAMREVFVTRSSEAVAQVCDVDVVRGVSRTGDPPGQTVQLPPDEAPTYRGVDNSPRPRSRPMPSVRKTMLSRRGCGVVWHSTTSPPPTVRL